MTQLVTLHYPGTVVRLRTAAAQALDVVEVVQRAWGGDEAANAFIVSSHERSGITSVWHLRADDVIGIQIQDDDDERLEERGCCAREDEHQWVGLLGLTWQLFRASFRWPSKKSWSEKSGRFR